MLKETKKLRATLSATKEVNNESIASTVARISAGSIMAMSVPTSIAGNCGLGKPVGMSPRVVARPSKYWVLPSTFSVGAAPPETG